MAPEDARALLDAFAGNYLRGQMVAGSILDRRDDLLHEGGVFRLTGEYACQEMIGRVRSEEMIESGENH